MIGRDVVRAVTRALVASVEAQAPAEARAMRDAVERLVAAPDQAAWQLAAPEVEAALDALAARRIRIGAAAPHLPKPPRRELAHHALPPPYDVHTGYDGLEVWRN